MAKKEIKLLIFSIIFSVLINVIIYNYRLIIYYLLGFEVNSIQYHAITRLVCYFIFCILINKTGSVIKDLIIFFIPVLLIDATTIFTGKELIPLRFPFDTIYPLLGILTGVYFHKNNKTSWSLVITTIAFLVTAQLYLRPMLLWYMREKNQPKLVQHNLLNYSFLTLDSNLVKLNDIKSNTILIDVYFIGCKPCSEKLPTLKKISQLYSGLKVILICDGAINNFKEFKIFTAQNLSNYPITSLYDYNKTIGNIGINGYPTEYLIKNGVIRNVDNGFSKALEKKWYKKEITIIEKLLSNE